MERRTTWSAWRRRGRHRARRACAAAALAVLAASSPRPVLAHATLTRSDPADGAVLAEVPREVRLWFSEDVSRRFSSVELFDAGSKPVATAGLRADPTDAKLLDLVLPDLPLGLYSVLWTVLSETDSHLSRGFLVFAAGEGADPSAVTVPGITSAPPIGEVLLRWINLSLLVAWTGAVAVLRFLIPADERAAAVLGAARCRVLAWARACAVLGVAAGVGLLFWHAATVRETLPQRPSLASVGWQMLVRTRWGTLWLSREALLLALTGVLWAQAAGPRPLRRERSTAALVLAVAVIAVETLTGHAATLDSNVALAVVADLVHLLAASLWVGGLVALGVGLLPLARQDRDDFASIVRAGWRPFSRVAAVSVALLLASGSYGMGRQVASLDALVTTPYGKVLSAKIGLTGLMGALGLASSMLLHPGRVAGPLARLLRRPTGWTPLRPSRLPALVVSESALAPLVLLAAGFITAAPSPRGAEFTIAPESVHTALTETVDDLVVTLSGKPNRPGPNAFTVSVGSTRRPPPAEVVRVILRLTFVEEDLGRRSVVAEEVQPGRFLLGSVSLARAGLWRIDVVVRRRGIEDRVARFDWLVPPAGGVRPARVSKRPLETPLTAAAAGIVLTVVVVPLLVRVRLRVRKRAELADLVTP